MERKETGINPGGLTIEIKKLDGISRVVMSFNRKDWIYIGSSKIVEIARVKKTLNNYGIEVMLSAPFKEMASIDAKNLIVGKEEDSLGFFVPIEQRLGVDIIQRFNNGIPLSKSPTEEELMQYKKTLATMQKPYK